MIIKKLHIKNFQIHKNKKLQFTEGINAIVGETDKGKSAIMNSFHLLLENQPRGADKLFQKIGEKKSYEIELEDTEGNIVKRKKKKYFLNKTELKAFNKEVPAPIKELFFTKPINWHKQFDSHFLILLNPGQAAKALNASTGLEEQEIIIKEIKERQLETKGEIKRLTINSEEAKDRIRKLKPVKRLLINARTTRNFKNKLEDKLEKIEEISELVNSLDNINKKIKHHNIKLYLSQISEVIELLSVFEKKQNETQILIDLLEKIDDSGTIDSNFISQTIEKIQRTLDLLASLSKKEAKVVSLQSYLETYLVHEKNTKSITIRKKEKENNLKEIFKKLKKCPLCEKEI